MTLKFIIDVTDNRLGDWSCHVLRGIASDLEAQGKPVPAEVEIEAEIQRRGAAHVAWCERENMVACFHCNECGGSILDTYGAPEHGGFRCCTCEVFRVPADNVTLVP